MSIPGILTPLFSTGSSAAAAAGYQVERSLRFNSSDSAYLSRTPAVAGTRTTWTWAGWVKRSGLNSFQHVFNNTSILPIDGFMFQPDNSLKYRSYNGSSENIQLITTQVFRDVSAWFHLVVVYDSTQGTTANRIKIYVNGIQVTSFSTATYPTPNYISGVNNTDEHSVGAATPNTYSGYLADIHFIDGQALDATAFTQVSATTGQLIPKAYAGTYTGNSFWLKFNDNSSNTATTLGKDSFLLGNNWTPNNLSVTAGSGNDSLVDTPTSYGTDTGVGGQVRGNYATLNPLNASGTLSDGNLQGVTSTGGTRSLATTVAVSSGKFYVEITCTNVPVGSYGANLSIGVSLFTFPIDSNSRNYSFADGVTYFADGTKYVNGSNSSYGASYATGNIIGIAIDIDSNQITFYKNGVSQGTISKTFSGAYVITVTEGDSSQQSTVILNAGQRAFAYQTPGTNRPAATFKALCDTNLPAPLVALPNTVFNVITYTGNGGTQTLPNANSTPSTPLAFSPDWVWVKARGTPNGLNRPNQLFDTVRGAPKALSSNRTDEEDASGGYDNDGAVTAFTSDGFTVEGQPATGFNSNAYVAWAWDAGANSSKTYTVTVVGGIFYIDGKSQPTINLEEGSTYIFDQSAASNSSHPLRFSTTSNGTHGGGTEYTTGVTTVGTPGNAGAYTQIAVASSAPALYYYCTNHSGMGGAINTNTTAGASNFVGSITSTVRANVSAGFSIITATTPAPAPSTYSVGHGLGVTPSMWIWKHRGAVSNWTTWHTSLGTGTLALNTTGSTAATGLTLPTSSIITLKDGPTAAWNDPIVIYAWAPVVGYSSFGSYTGNGLADGPFVYTGFRPKYVLMKASSTGGSFYYWYVFDSARDTENPTDRMLFPNVADQESSTYDNDFLANGFKLRTNAIYINNSGVTYIYMAFAENPFQYARAR